ncbi:EAL domain-containing response regulator [Arthrospira platensis]|uniref:EAL domain-containing response regulator n=1 Tax=Limnospira TaxID=2596745 RepID=UPI000291FBFA|nr:EAL domain-containing response regulator [Arthrospira platensis]AMW30669.1 diguanylate phosphodiesterase [Arthrospira platensis YZ]KDR55295.1 diguanylate phosphodiesterase [Arthrospira platensis str. Paraca]MBD2669989.1 EAL domain-containing protein [Arthrospira platensis FACHB-439]MBD2710464.1 EAL domain-containing protein [Arthrospira platensis FACHB-835]MDT9310797.1 EAL domain-containing protein [Limnospira sp. Paracas R14]QQW28607.1 EAL domain-containing protein [Arthrospira sp. PCC 91
MKSDEVSIIPGHILVVDDFLETLNLLTNLLEERGHKVRRAISGEMALMGAKANPPDLILLDINMPVMSGYDVCQQLQAEPTTQGIPVIFISALNEVFDKVKAFEVGGVDYITKPFQIEEVIARIENQIALKQAHKQIQQLNAELEQRVLQRTEELESANQELKKMNSLLEREILHHQQTQSKLLHMASHDALTGLPNRVFFMDKLMQAISETKQNPDYRFAVLFLDCDRFKVVNDSLGHLTGDRLLISLARRLQLTLKMSPTNLARFGGDEFTILLENIHSTQAVTVIAERLQKALTWPFQLDEQDLFLEASIGIVIGTSEYTEPEQVLRDADIAMYKAKSQGRGCYRFFDGTMHNDAHRRFQLENDLRLAIENNHFLLNYQPIIELQDGSVMGFEALLRWHHPEHGIISPAEFIPIAEDTGLIIPIGLWVLDQAVKQLNLWQKKGLITPQFRMSVNLSVKQFTQPYLIEEIDRILVKNNFQSSYLKLEITETAIVENPEAARQLLQQLTHRNIHLSLDDFGTGYSSLSYLHRFPVNTLKIDRSFITCIGTPNENLQIVDAIITLAHQLKINVVAEGIETAEQLAKLRSLGCDQGQGYYFSKPVESMMAEDLLKQRILC